MTDANRVRVALVKETTLGSLPSTPRMRTTRDTGEGLKPEVRERLFEPFFTTKPAGQGLGLGLVISAQIVREFGGNLVPHPGAQGMEFRFDLEAVTGDKNV